MTPDERVIAEMDSLVASNPEFVYTGPEGFTYCRYTDEEGNPSCGIAQLLDRLGVKFSDLDELGVDAWPVIRERLGISLRVRTTLEEFHRNQDTLRSWGESWKNAKFIWGNR